MLAKHVFNSHSQSSLKKEEAQLRHGSQCWKNKTQAHHKILDI